MQIREFARSDIRTYNICIIFSLNEKRTLNIPFPQFYLLEGVTDESLLMPGGKWGRGGKLSQEYKKSY